MTRYGKVSAGLIAIWLAAATAAAASHVFQNDANRLGASVGIAATLPILLFAAWMAASKGFREFALGLRAQTLTALQTGRAMGVVL